MRKYGVEAPTPLICKNTFTIDQQLVKTNSCFSHFSDNFFRIFHTQIQILPRHGKKWTQTKVVFPFSNTFFSIFPIHISIMRRSREKMGLDPLFSHTFFPHPNRNFDMFWKKWSRSPTGKISICNSLCVWA